MNANTYSLQATSYTEVSRIHKNAVSTLQGSLVITAATAGEGTSIIAHLMAQRSAESGRRTLILDLNLKNAALSNELLGERYSWNLTEREVDDKLTDLIHPVKDVDNLFILPAPLDPSSVNFLKDTVRAAHLLDVLEMQFDHIIIDTTPLNATNRYNADPVIISAAAKRTLLVVMGAKTMRKKIHAAIRELREAGANIDGIIMNNRDNPSIKEQLQRICLKIKPILPGLSSWLSYKINQDTSLD